MSGHSLNSNLAVDDSQYEQYMKGVLAKLRVSDSQYLKDHPEIIAIVRVIWKRLAQKNPKHIGPCVYNMMRPMHLPEFVRRINSEMEEMREEFPEDIDKFYCKTFLKQDVDKDKHDHNDEDSSMCKSKSNLDVDAMMNANQKYPIDLQSFATNDASCLDNVSNYSRQLSIISRYSYARDPSLQPYDGIEASQAHSGTPRFKQIFKRSL